MIRTTRIKIWTLLSQAFIIIGMGHGIVTLGIAEPIWLVTLFDQAQPADGGDVSDVTLRLVALMSLIGQTAIVSSIYTKEKCTDISLHITGLFFLWAALLTYAYGIRNDTYSHLAVFSCFPFLYFTIRTLLGMHIGKLWQWVLEL